MAGNGGKMAAAQQAMVKGARRRKISSTTENGIREKERRKRDRADERAARKDGAERLRQAADRRVGRNSAKLADVLTQKALMGDLGSTKMLVVLADGKKAVPVKRRGLSLPERLGAEPQWEGPAEAYDWGDGEVEE